MYAGCAGKTVRSLENACHTWAPYRYDHDQALYKFHVHLTFTLPLDWLMPLDGRLWLTIRRWDKALHPLLVQIGVSGCYRQDDRPTHASCAANRSRHLCGLYFVSFKRKHALEIETLRRAVVPTWHIVHIVRHTWCTTLDVHVKRHVNLESPSLSCMQQRHMTVFGHIARFTDCSPVRTVLLAASVCIDGSVG